MTMIRQSFVSLGCTIATIAGIVMVTSNANASEITLGASWAATNNSDLHCAVGATCQRADNKTGKVYGDYTFEVSSFGDIKVRRSIEGMLYQINKTKASFGTNVGLKNGTGNASGVGLLYALDIGVENIGITSRFGVNYSRAKVNFLNGAQESKNALLAYTMGLGLRYSLNKNVSLVADFDRIPVKFTSSSNAKTINHMYSLGIAYTF